MMALRKGAACRPDVKSLAARYSTQKVWASSLRHCPHRSCKGSLLWAAVAKSARICTWPMHDMHGYAGALAPRCDSDAFQRAPEIVGGLPSKKLPGTMRFARRKSRLVCDVISDLRFARVSKRQLQVPREPVKLSFLTQTPARVTWG